MGEKEIQKTHGRKDRPVGFSKEYAKQMLLTQKVINSMASTVIIVLLIF